MTRHYLDHASTSPPRPEVVAAMGDWMARASAGELGDPGRIHHEGMAARVEIEQAREDVAAFLGARSREVVFTSGATESIATAVGGAAERGDHFVLAAVEHSAVRESVAELVGAGTHTATIVPVDGAGRVDPQAVADALDGARRDGRTPALVCVQTGNHEVGTLQPVAEVIELSHERDVLVHVDAAAAAGHIPLTFDASGADLLSISAHKFGGPGGVGALLVRRGLRVQPLLRGGDQERARRAGFEHGAAIVGLASACRALTDESLSAEAGAARLRTDRVLTSVPGFDGVRVYGDPRARLPHLVCLGIDGIEPQAVLLGLDRAGIAAHSGSACSSEALEPSPVLEAMGVDAHRSLRISVGWNTTDDDIDALLDALPKVIAPLRAMQR